MGKRMCTLGTDSVQEMKNDDVKGHSRITKQSS